MTAHEYVRELAMAAANTLPLWRSPVVMVLALLVIGLVYLAATD